MFLPFWLLYPLSNLVCGFLQYVILYRQKIIEGNLLRVFPTKAKTERNHIKSRFYRQFADILVESIKGLSISEAELRHRYHYENPELLDKLARQHGGLLLLGGHYANWEWGVQSFPLWVKTPVLGIFKPIQNRYINQWMQQQRSRFGLQLTAMAQIGRYIAEKDQSPRIYVLIADQMPSGRVHAIWADLLGYPTPFLNGPEKLAYRTGFPVAHFRVSRLKRGYYKVRFELLSEHPRELFEGELTKRYATAIGEVIKAAPADWLWSHRRWKW